MSFSGKVKEELARNISSARHCQIAELTAFIGMCGTVVINSFDRCSIKIRTENILVARKVFTLIEKTFNIRSDISVRRNIKKQTENYSVIVKKHDTYLTGYEDDGGTAGECGRVACRESDDCSTGLLSKSISPRSVSGVRIYE